MTARTERLRIQRATAGPVPARFQVRIPATMIVHFLDLCLGAWSVRDWQDQLFHHDLRLVYHR
jgi:hypothetical protein